MERATISALTVLLGAAVATSVVLVRSREPETSRPLPAPLEMGYYARDAVLTVTGDDGRILYRVAAAHVEQEPADGRVDLRDVTVAYDPSADIPWHLQADAGLIRPDGKMIELSGNVVAATREADGPAATIRTDYLEFDPGTHVAATDRKVFIDYAGSTVQATGLRAMLQEDRLELLADVTGRYVR